MSKVKEVSTRLMRPTLPDIRVDRLVDTVSRWNTDWESDASVHVYDEGLAQYMLVDEESHYKFYASICLGKASIRCSLVADEPEDQLDEEAGNVFNVISSSTVKTVEMDLLMRLKEVLEKRGYRFSQ